MAFPVRRLLWSLLVLGILVALAVGAVRALAPASRQGAVTPRATLLSNPTVRDWMHALSEEEREVASLRRQAQRQPGVALPPGEALDQEEAQLQRTWRSLYAEWLADGGRGEECPGFAEYQMHKDTPAPGK
jgi:hypothetical protein